MTQFVDWDLAAATARTVAGSGPNLGLSDAKGEVRRLRETAARAADHVAEFTGLVPSEAAAVRVVDRPAWSAANVEGMRSLLDPLAHKVSGEPGVLVKVVGSRLAGTQVGAVLGFLSGKVLGQYEIFGQPRGRLLLVAPNIVETQRRLDADAEDFRMWVCLHEATHAAQFGAVDWLRDHFMSEIDLFAAGESSDGMDLAQRFRRAVTVVVDSVRDVDNDSSVMDLVTSPQQREALERITAMMTLLEGHADYIMDEVGKDVMGDVASLRRKLDHRRLTSSPIQRIVRRLLGVDVKFKQYVRGRAFVSAVVDEVGMERFNKVWTSPQTLPDMEEIADPAAWVRRVA
ncbi:MAG TPA: zinc-dependent metalloprotease [Candidatus Stackebrandtia excrementipullorum]|nr:zinc-dependent metalloprotease [Candidatus Stackebrandtia excrementipullorum]